MAVDLPRDSEKELILAPNEFCYVQNSADGGIQTCVGPLNVNLGQNERTIVFDPKSKKFVSTGANGIKPIQHMVTAPSGWYVVLLNPCQKKPDTGKKSTYPDQIDVGKKVIIPGPVSFALWPGQIAKVIEGHRLRSNEYLLVEVYDAPAARENWSKGTVQFVVDTGTTGTGVDDADKDKAKDKAETDVHPPTTPTITASDVPSDLANGKRYIIKGTEIAFYIPPTGVKVVEMNDSPSGTDQYIRQAVSLENLEYAILLAENGEKEYHYGPKVVFPNPTQSFIRINGKTKYKALELDARKGIHIKVIENYKDGEGEKAHLVGEELFITGDGLIYMPRKEHSIIKYGEQDVHYATAIPDGDGWYELDRVTGQVTIIKGPRMYLPDPRQKVFTRRILTPKEVSLFYPGNSEAARINAELMISNDGDFSAAGLTNSMSRSLNNSAYYSSSVASAAVSLKKGLDMGDSFDRKTEYTPPRTIVLGNKYMGAIPINIWTGHAVKVVDNKGAGRVEVGPKALLLEYNETLEPMILSTGKPKTTDRLLETAYLKVKGNRITDIITDAQTSDMVSVDIKCIYQVDFLDDQQDKWYTIENYVKHLCDHIRSILKATVKKIDILTLYANITDIIRDAILGVKPEVKIAEGDAEVETPKRPGMIFPNGMMIYDVEVMDLMIKNPEVKNMIQTSEKGIFRNILDLRDNQQEAETTEKIREYMKRIMEAKTAIEDVRHKFEVTKQVNETKEAEGSKNKQGVFLAMDLEKAKTDSEADVIGQKATLEMMNAQVAAAAEIAQVFTPQLIEAIKNLKDATVVSALSANFKDLAILEDKGIMATANKFLDMFPQGLQQIFNKDADKE